LATQVVSRVRSAFGVEIGVRSLFEAPTIAGLVEKMTQLEPSVGQRAGGPPIQPYSRDREFPLSYAQQRLWFIQQMEPDSVAYNMPHAIRLRGELGIKALWQSLGEVGRRHEVLRTRFESREGQPRQVIEMPSQIELPVWDLSGLEAGRREQRLGEIAAEEAVRPFNLGQGPVWRAALVRVESDDQVLLWSVHHIASDGWSDEVMVKELRTISGAYRSGKPSPLPELTLQYADYALWQREWLQGEILEQQLDYWRRRVTGMTMLDLPADRRRRPIPTHHCASVVFRFSDELTHDLKELSRREGVTLFMTLLAGFQTLLARYTVLEDITIGSPIAGRHRAEVEGLIGFFVNTLLMRTDFSGNPTVRDILWRVRETALGAYGHQDLPFEKLVEELQPPRSLNFQPLFQVMLVFQNASLAVAELQHLGLAVEQFSAQAAKFDLTLSLTEIGGELHGGFEFATDLYDRSRIARLVESLRRVLELMAGDLNRRLTEIDLFSEVERHQMLVEWNATETKYSTDKSIAELFEQQIERSPEAVAVIYEGQHLSYEELNRRANQLARYLRGEGVGAEVMVGVCLERRPELVVALLATLKAGGAFVPLDPDYPAERLNYMLEDSGVAVVVTMKEFEPLFLQAKSRCLLLDRALEEMWEAESGVRNRDGASGEAAAYVIYTSGSTGQPKGVVGLHRSTINRLSWMWKAYPYEEGETCCVKTALNFVDSIAEILGPLLQGVPVVMISGDRLRDGRELMEVLETNRVTRIVLVPSLLRMMLESGIEEWRGLPRLKYWVSSGEELQKEVVEKFREKLSDRVLLNLYGSSEVAGDVSWTEVERCREITIGRPISNTEIYLVGVGEPVVMGVVGELCVGGANLARGYLKRPALTAEMFIPNPMSEEPGGRMYRTGDLGRYRFDGRIEHAGRRDRQVKIRGHRIECGEVEEAIRQLAGVKQCAVGVRGRSGSEQLVAYVEAEEGRELRGGELRRAVREKLPEYMTPGAFVKVAEMRYTANGKLDRRSLALIEGEESEEEQEGVAPSPVEELVAGIWEEVLGRERVGVKENFFEAGGHSLLATQVISRVREVLGVELGLRALFENPTVAAMAEEVERERRAGRGAKKPAIERVRRDVELELSYAQQRMWFIQQLEPESSAYHIPAALRLKGKIEVAALRQSLWEIVRRHEALRTRFEQRAGRPAQVIEEWRDTGLEMWDLSGQEAGEAERIARRVMREVVARPFDLEKGPVWRAGLARLREDEHLLVVCLHHVAGDGWSMGVIVKEFSRLYERYREGVGSGLVEPAAQYADYAIWQREWLQGEALEEQLSYWRKQLSGAPVLELPTDHSRLSAANRHGANVEFALSGELTRRLEELSRREGVTLYMTLLTGFQALLARYSGQSDIAVGTPISGRNRAEIEGLVGFFVNTLVMRTDFSGDPTVSELMRKVRETALEAYRHQDLPFEKLVEELQPERSLSQEPLFQVLFVLQNIPRAEERISNVVIAREPTPTTAARFDLELVMVEGKQGLEGQINYDSELFERHTILRMVERLRRLWEVMTDAADRLITGCNLLTEAEQWELSGEWNDTQVQYCEWRSVSNLFERQVEMRPEAVALVYEGRQLSYGELNRRAEKLSQYLRERGVGPEVCVGVCLERSLEMMVGLLGVLKAGGAYLPLDASYPGRRLSFMMKDAEAPVLLTQERLLDKAAGSEAEVICVDRDWDEIEEESGEDLGIPVGEENLAYVIYTSGSTGQPKGVMVTQVGLRNYLMWSLEAYGMKDGDGSVLHSPLGFDLTVTSLYPPLLVGGRLILTRESEGVGGLSEALRSESGLGLVKLTPAHLEALAQWMPAEEMEGRTKALVIGGEALFGERLKKWREYAPGTRLINEYGPSETVVGCCVYEVKECEKLSGGVPIGRPIANTKMYILGERQEPMGIGESGELYIGGSGVGRGYLKRPELTGERFIPHPFSEEPGARLYRTGDLARYRGDGNLEFLGRIDHQVKIRGYRIELGEIEAALREHPEVSEAVVEARQEGESEKRLVAYLVGEGEGVPSHTELRDFLRQRLPEYMAPGVFVELEELPLTPSGKIDRRALPEPEGRRPELDEGYVAPRTQAERVLAEIWSQALGLQQVGVYDNFFRLGGDSILGIQIVVRANQAGLRLTTRHLFQYQRIAELAAMAETAAIVEAEQGPVNGPLPLTPIQRWFFEREPVNPSHFNQAVLLGIGGDIEERQLEQALRHLVAHHDALRLRFKLGPEGWQAENAAIESRHIFTHYDLSGETAEEQKAKLEEIGRQTQKSLDVSRGPLIRAAMIYLGGGRGRRLLIAIHHLAVDGVSWRILLEDLETACRQLGSGERVQLPAKTTSFREWAQRMKEYAEAEEMEAEESYWKGKVGKSVRPLPRDYEEGVNTVASGRQVWAGLSQEETRALLQETPAVYHTQINDVLLACLAQVLTRWSGEGEALIELEGHGREDVMEGVDVSRTVGWFTSLYPVVLELREGAGSGEVLKSIKEQLREVPKRGMGYGVVKYLRERAPEGEWRGWSKAEVSFNYLGQFDQVLRGESRFWLASEGAGETRGGEERRSHLLEVEGSVIGGRLQVVWSYSEEAHARSTVERLAEDYIEALREMIAHCRSEGAGGYTPSDFELARLGQAEIDELMEEERELEDVYPLSAIQQGLLFHSLYEPESGVYFNQIVFRLEEKLEVEAFKEAWRRLIERHAILRTGFRWKRQGRPLQVVVRKVETPWREEDWREKERGEQEEELGRLLEEDCAKGFDFSKAPLMRLRLIRIGEREWEFIWSFHHILLDGWSIPLVMRELFDLYEGMRYGKPLELTPSRPYRDYIEWLGRQDMERAERYWRGRLKGFTSPTRLDVEWGDGAARVMGGEFAEELIGLGENLSEELRRVAREWHLTLNTVVQGSWAVLLSRYSGQRDVVFGATVSGRPGELAGVERMVGLFINTLPVRVEMRENERVAEWLKRLQEEQAEQRQYEYSPLVEVQGWSEAPRGAPLFENLLVFENYPVDKELHEQMAEGTVLGVRGARVIEKAHYPLTLMIGTGRQLGVRISYDRGRYDDETIRRMSGHLLKLLESVARDAERRPSELEMLSEAEREQVLVEWNETWAARPEGSVVGLFERQVAMGPEAVALVCEERQLSYGELNRRADQLSQYLRERGVGPEARVGVCLERGLEMMIALIGTLKAGGAFVPMDTAHPVERLAYQIENSGARIVVTKRRTVERIAVREAELVCLDADWKGWAVECGNRVAAEVGPRNLAYVIYTSGSTGKPKGVGIEQAGWINFLVALLERTGIRSGDVWLAVTSLSFDISMLELFLPLISGGRVVVARREDVEDGGRLKALLSESEATHMQATPSGWRLLVEAGWEGREGLKVWCGGEALPVSLGEALVSRSVEAWNLYGPTETTIWSSMWKLERGLRRMTVGRPIANTECYILDERMEAAPIGVAGELYIGGDGLARGYFGRPELTAEQFVVNPFGSEVGERLYRTGDLVRYREGGEIEYLGRMDHQVKIRGYRIELGEIETILSQHPGVRESVVVAREDEPGEKRLVAYIVPEGANEALLKGETEKEATTNSAPSGVISGMAKDLRRYLREKLPEYMLPSAFVELRELPLLTNGKLNRKALPEPKTAATIVKGQQERSPVEEIVAGIWADVLQRERIGITEDFFELGGHSLLVTQVVSRIRKTLGVDVGLRTLFESPTVKGLAEVIERERHAGNRLEIPAIRQASRDHELPLSYAQQRLWFIHQLIPDSAAYNLPLVVRLRGAVDISTLRQSLGEIIRRHEVLRTRFPSLSGRPIQVIDEPDDIELAILDVSGLCERERERLAQEVVALDLQRPFDLERGPVWRAALVKLGAEDQALLVCLHHVATDAWSTDILVKEFASLYQGYREGRSAVLSGLPLQYADFAVWQRSWLQGEVLLKQMDYWRRQLKGAPSLELALGRPRPAVTGRHSAKAPFKLSAELSQDLNLICRREGVTLFMLLLAAFQTLLYRYTGMTDIVVGTPIANRNREELERLIGFFVNLLALRTDLSGTPTFLETLSRVREVTLSAFTYQDLPFEKIVEELHPERGLEETPLFRIALILQNAPRGVIELPDLSLQPFGGQTESSIFDLALYLWEEEERISGYFLFDIELYEMEAIARLTSHFQTLLEGIVAQPGARICDLPLLDEAEKQSLLNRPAGRPPVRRRRVLT